jgi:hypothetical protein
MTKHYIIIILAFLTLNSSYGQSSKVTCDCPKFHYADTKADTTFHFSNGKIIVLCGYKNPNSKPTNFSEFILSVCGQDTILDFWSAVMTCQLETIKDTLLVEEIKNLPTGEDFKFQPTIWTIEKIYFLNGKIIRKLETNKSILKYNEKEIKMVLQEFETRNKGHFKEKMDLANKLFIASISGSEMARKYFGEFKEKFEIHNGDGAYAEEYHDLKEMLNLWYMKK